MAFNHRPRCGRAFAAMLAVAAGGWLMATGADAPPIQGSNPPPTAAGTAPAGDSAGTTEDYGNLERFINLQPERLAALIKMLQDLQKMPPEEKRQIQMRIQSIRQVQMEIMADLRLLSPPDRALLNAYIRVLLPDEAQAWILKLKASPIPEKRKLVIQAMLDDARKRGIVPPPPPVGRGGPPGGPRGAQGQGMRGGPGGRSGQGPDANNRPHVPETEAQEATAPAAGGTGATNP